EPGGLGPRPQLARANPRVTRKASRQDARIEPFSQGKGVSEKPFLPNAGQGLGHPPLRRTEGIIPQLVDLHPLTLGIKARSKRSRAIAGLETNQRNLIMVNGVPQG